jgi:hypothetical protein
VELLWSYLKYGRLANLAPDTVDEIGSHVRRERRRLARRPELLRCLSVSEIGHYLRIYH